MSTTITPTEQNIEINVNNDVIDINVTNEIVDVNATTQQIDINVAGAYPIPNPVLSVFGRTGVVVATEGDYTLTQLGDVTLTSPTNGQVLKYNGTTWVNGTDAGGLTSVGLSMPTAFTVTNSPLTSNGTIAVTGAGTTAQYVRGDGTLATFPSIITQAQNLVTEVYNRTGATLTKGTIVYINGGQGNLPTVTKALAVGDSTSAQTYGVVQTDITNMNNGYVVVAGRLSDLDTQAYTEGTQLYLSSTTAGTWTSTKQYAPAHLVYVGIVVRSHPTQGIVEIKIQNGYELDEIHNVAAQTPTNNDGLFWESATSLWKNKSIATILGGTPVTGTGTTNYLAKFTGSSTIGIGQVLDDGTSVLIGTTSSTPNVKVGIYSTTQRALEVVSTNSNALFVQSPAAFIATISNGTWVTNFTNTGRLDLAGDLLVNTIANATTDTDRFLVSDSGVIKYRTGAELLSDIGGQGALTNPITGTGTSGQVAYFNGTNSITSNAAFAFTPTSQLLVNNSVTAATQIARGTNLNSTLIAAANNDVLVGLDINPSFTNGAFTSVRNIGLRVGTFNYDLANQRLGLGTNIPTDNVEVITSITTGIAIHSNGTGANGRTYLNLARVPSIGSTTETGWQFIKDASDNLIFNSLTSGSASNRMILFTTGNLGINQTTDAGFRLDVNGTARVQYGTTEQGFNMTHSNGTTAAIVLGNGSAAGTGVLEIFRNGVSVVSFNSSVVQFRFANLKPTGNTATLQLTGGIGFGNSIGTSVRLQANTFDGGAFTATSGTQSTVVVGNSSNEIWSPSSGNATYNLFSVVPVINTSGTYSGIVRGYFYNPTLTSVTGVSHRAFENVSGDVLLGTTSGNVAIGTSTLATATELTLGGSQTASSAIARGQLLNTTLVAAANNDVLVGLDINPTFTNGAFTGVSNVGLRVQSGGINVTGNSSINGQLLIGSTTLGINPFLQINSNGRADIVLRTNGTNDNAFSIYAVGGAYGSNYAEFGTNNGLNAANQGGAIYTDSRTGLVPPIRFAVKGTGTTTMSIAGAIQSNGNWGINTTTDAGFRLDVNGTARVQGAFTNVINGWSTIGGIAIGSGANGNGFTRNSIAIGNSASASAGSESIAIGAAATATANYQCVIGGSAAGSTGAINELYVGNGITAANPTAYSSTTIIQTTSGSGTDIAGRSITIAPGRSTGAGTSPDVIFATPTVISSGTTLQTLTNRWWIKGNTGQLSNVSTPNASAALQVDATTQGFLPPRMTTTQRNAISSPATGLVVYDTTDNELDYYNGTAWQSLMTLGTQQTVTGFKQFSASRTASLGVAQGTLMTPTLIASANNDVLVGLDISPTYSNGAFTGVTNTALRVIGNTNITGTLAIGNTVTSASSVSSTHKVSIIIGGVQYYLLASNV